MNTYPPRISMSDRLMTTKAKTGIITSNANATARVAISNMMCIAPIIPQVVRN